MIGSRYPTICLADDWIVRFGDLPASMFFVVHGLVEMRDGNGKRLHRSEQPRPCRPHYHVHHGLS